MNALLFVAKRILLGLATLGVLACINFVLVHAAPGDPVTIIAGESGSADEKLIEDLRERFGLDKPLPVQLGTYLLNLSRLDLGYSYRQGRPVIELIAERLPATLLLTGTAFVLSLAAGVLIGVWASTKAGTRTDSLINLVITLFYAIPVYFLAIVIIVLANRWVPWMPTFGYRTVGADYTGLMSVLDVASHLALPTLVLAMFYMAVYARMTRSAMLEVAADDFVGVARSKGLSRGRILRAHILRNAMLPIVTVAGLQAGTMVGGAVLIETVFAWPGIGRLLFDALSQRDYNLLLGTFFITAVLTISVNIVTDIIYAIVDPRIAL